MDAIIATLDLAINEVLEDIVLKDLVLDQEVED